MKMRSMIAMCVLALSSPILLSAQNGQSGLDGTVLTDSSGRPMPVPNAEVSLVELGIADTTDSVGDFSFRVVPAGTYTLVIRAIGFGAFQARLAFLPNEIMSRDFTLRKSTDMNLTLARASAGDAESSRLSDFEARRKMGSGRFITRDVFEQSNGRRRFADLLVSNIPGIQLVSSNGERAVATGNRGMISFGSKPGEAGAKKACYVQVIMDNIVRYRSTPGEKLFNVDNVDPQTVVGVEFYTVSQTPLQFNSTGGSPCGTLVVWTRS